MLVEDGIKYFEESNIALADKFVPYYCSSIACHLGNLENQDREFYIRQGERVNMRLHMFFVAPPGFSKSLFLRRILGDTKSKQSNKRQQNKNTGLGSEIREGNEGDNWYMLADADIGTGFEGSMNEASYVGTVRENGGDYELVYGAAYEHKRSILGIDEFSVLSDTMKQSYGKTLDEALLTSLESGYLKKRLRNGKLNYITHLTLWSNSQPMRFDISSGIGRRFFFIYFIPTKEEEQLIRDMARKDDDSYASDQTLEDIGDDVEIMKANMSKLNSISFDDEIYDLFDENHLVHFEENIFKKLAFGYFMSNTMDMDRDVNISFTGDMKKYIQKGIEWRKEIKKGPEVTQVVRILNDRGPIMNIGDLKEKLVDFGLNYKQATRAIRELISSGIVEKEKRESAKTGKKKTVVKLSEIA